MYEITNATIRDKLVQLYGEDEDAFVCIMYFLDEQEKLYGENDVSPIWKTFETALESDKLFQLCANKLLEDIKTAEADKNYKISMTKFWSEMMEPPSELENGPCYVNRAFQHSSSDAMGLEQVNVCSGAAASESPIPVESEIKDLEGTHKLVFDSSLIFVLEDVVPKPDKKPFNKSKGLDKSTQTLIIKKIVELIAEDPNAFTRLMYSLNEKGKTYGENGTAPTLKTLKAASERNNLFQNYVDKLVEDTKSTESNVKYKMCMTEISNELDEQNKPENGIFEEGFEIISGNEGLQNYKACFGFAEAMGMLTPEARAKILDWIRQVVGDGSLTSGFDKVVALVNKSGISKARIVLALLELRYNVWKNLRRWQKGEISGKRCTKNILDSIVSIGGSIGGGIAGAHIGILGGAVVTVAGGVVGSVLAAHVATLMSDWLTRKIFQLPKSESLENAYNYFGVGMSATDAEINRIYRQRMLQHHPDRPGGRAEDFHQLQFQMNVIKEGRRQTTC